MRLRHLLAALVPLVAVTCRGGEAPSPRDSAGTWEGPLLVRLEPEFVLGGPAPDFALSILTADGVDKLPGDTLRLSELLGDIIILDFWNTGCKPCIREHATLVEVADTYRPRGVRFFGVSDFDTPESLARFANRHGPFTYPNLSDRGREAKRAYHVRGWPTKAVIDTAGNVAWWRPGGPIERDVLVDVIEDVLAGRRPDAVTSAAYPPS